ncbi:hypothetical protein CBS101457_003656 [Exobasidium rhododendri]|nr:hypothetical protein CBS101457_003656 [Exobasidium rhododendri]
MDVDLSKAAEVQDRADLLSISLFSLINQARNEHGLRQQDFKRYRLFCSTKLHHLREIMNKTHVDKVDTRTKGSKKNQSSHAPNNKKQLSKKQKLKAQSATVQSANSKGKGHVFVRKSIAVEEVKDDRPAQLLLFEAERAWAYSQELKQESFQKEQDGAIRRHGLSRSRRSVQWSTSLLSLLLALGPKRVDVMTRAEVTAYHALLRGYESFDKKSYTTCVEQLSVTRKLLYAIAEASNDSRIEALSNSYVDSTEAMLRFCAYNLDIGEQDMDVLAKDMATPQVCEKIVPGFERMTRELHEHNEKKRGSQEAKKLVSVQWHAKAIAIRNPELVDVILKVESVEEKLRHSLKVKEESGEKVEVDKNHQRKRLTSAQRSAKKRSFGDDSASSANRKSQPKNAAASTSKVLTTSSKTEMDGYDSLLAALTEAEDTARRLVTDNAEALAKSHSSRYEAASTDLINAHEYLLYKLLAVRIERNVNLIEDVQEKGDRRQSRVQDIVERRLDAVTSERKVRKGNSEPVRRRVKAGKRKVRPAARKTQKKQKKASAGSGLSRPAQGKKPSPKRKQEEERLRKQSLLKKQRIVARGVPGVAKLLDSCEMSCTGITTLGLVENEANVSTLMEAKSAWFKSELLRFLAKSYLYHGEQGKSLVLLNRSELFIREARSAMELVDEEEVERENEEVKPVMAEATFVKSEELIEQARKQTQKDVFVKSHGEDAKGKTYVSRSTTAQSKANIAINDLAGKYVDFDPVDLEQALHLNSDREAQLWEEVHGTREFPDEVDQETWQDETAAKSERTTGFDRHQRQISMATTTVSDDFDDQLVGKSNDTGGAYDPGNLVEDEEDTETEVGKKSGWLGGWFAKK